MKVSDMMVTVLHTITSDKSVAHAAERMSEHRVNSLLVMDHGEVIGMLTPRDICASHPNRIVADAMSPGPICISSDLTVWDAGRMMEEHGVEQALIMAEDKLEGWLTRETIKIKLAEYRDPLTGLFRAPYIQTIGERLLYEKKPFHLLFIDLNNFGQINKRYGHPFGDDVIREYSSLLAAMMDERYDHVSRYAGDEFVVISTADDDQIQSYIDQMETPIGIRHMQVSAAVGHVNGYSDANFFTYSFRELIEKASLLSTSTKQRIAGTVL
ncbi:MAG TPA: GGDEF domain-containing protein [Brevibacillus sp.]|nr:GGDEF domain-containing protein [Brevibacillus sp.]